jgi:hypothetical protein
MLIITLQGFGKAVRFLAMDLLDNSDRRDAPKIIRRDLFALTTWQNTADVAVFP